MWWFARFEYSYKIQNTDSSRNEQRTSKIPPGPYHSIDITSGPIDRQQKEPQTHTPESVVVVIRYGGGGRLRTTDTYDRSPPPPSPPEVLRSVT